MESNRLSGFDNLGVGDETWSTRNPFVFEEEMKSPSTEDSCPQSPKDSNENDMKTEFVNFRKKQFETGHVENIVRDTQRDSKTKKYSEKKKYENEWNRLNAVSDLESVMERASHFEEVDPDKYARLKSKLPNSPPSHENEHLQDNFVYDFNSNHPFDNNSQVKSIKTNLRQTSFDFPKGSLSSHQKIDLLLPRIDTSVLFHCDEQFRDFTRK